MAQTKIKLTLKQELFAHAYMKNNGNASAAYRDVYQADKMAQETINTEATSVKNHPLVSLRIKELEELRHKTAEMTESWRLDGIKRCFDESVAKGQYASSVKAMTEINKMLGGYDFKEKLNFSKKLSTLDSIEEKNKILMESVEAGKLSIDNYVKLITTLTNNDLKLISRMVLALEQKLDKGNEKD